MEGRGKDGGEPAHAQCPLPRPIWILTGPLFRIFSSPQNYHSQKTTTRSPEVFGNSIGELEAFKRHESWTQKSHLGPSDQGWSKMGEDSPSFACHQATQLWVTGVCGVLSRELSEVKPQWEWGARQAARPPSSWEG